MKAVRQRNTSPEVRARSFLHRAGFRFRVQSSSLPGRPDIINATNRWCVFVHGCFWHGHRGCRLARLPKTNREWWTTKISENRARDRRKELALKQLGFRVVTVWQCELDTPQVLVRRLRGALR